MFFTPSEDYYWFDNFSNSLSCNNFLEHDSIHFYDGSESFNYHFNVCNNINDINNKKDLDSKKSPLFQIEKPDESLIFHIIKKDFETVETNDSLNNKKNRINPKDLETNNYHRKKKKKNINSRKENTDNIRTKLINKLFKY